MISKGKSKERWIKLRICCFNFIGSSKNFSNNSFCLFLISSSLFLFFTLQFLSKFMSKSTNNPISKSAFSVIIVPLLWMPHVWMVRLVLWHLRSTLKWHLLASGLSENKERERMIVCLTWVLNILVLFLLGRRIKIYAFYFCCIPSSCKFLILDIHYFEFSTKTDI